MFSLINLFILKVLHRNTVTAKQKTKYSNISEKKKCIGTLKNKARKLSVLLVVELSLSFGTKLFR